MSMASSTSSILWLLSIHEHGEGLEQEKSPPPPTMDEQFGHRMIFDVVLFLRALMSLIIAITAVS